MFVVTSSSFSSARDRRARSESFEVQVPHNQMSCREIVAYAKLSIWWCFRRLDEQREEYNTIIMAKDVRAKLQVMSVGGHLIDSDHTPTREP